MKGYVFSVADADPIAELRRGVYGVYQSPSQPRTGTSGRPYWSYAMLETFADYATMSPGDAIFFFRNRLLYGIGRVIGSPRVPPARLNYVDADAPDAEPLESGSAVLGPSVTTRWQEVRVVVPFEPAPVFFASGLDMDEVLSSPDARNAWGLRFWERRSFMQLGVRETQMLIDAFLRRFYNMPGGIEGNAVEPALEHSGLAEASPLSVHSMVRRSPDRYTDGTRIRQESTLHGLLVEAIRDGDPAFLTEDAERGDIFHELSASPPKPALYADWIDVVGTRTVPTLSMSPVHFDLVEAKKDAVTGGADQFDRTVAQLMKYVDFVAANYADGNYGALSAYFVASSFSSEVLARSEDAATVQAGATTRSYILDPHESRPTRTWARLSLVKYRWNSDTERLELFQI